MRQLVIESGSALRVVDGPALRPGPADLLIEVGYCGVCGSDLHFLQDGNLADGTVLGHEFSGTVREIGSAVADVAPGQQVAVNPLLACGSCRHCGSGRSHLCRTGLHQGVGLGVTPGAFAQQVVVPAARAVALPAGLGLRDAALAEPLAVGVHAARMAVADGEPVLVVGAGPIGVFTALAVRTLADVPVLITSTNPERSAIAEAAGLRVTTVDEVAARHVPEFPGGRPRVIVEATGRSATLQADLDLVDAGGLIVLVGGTPEPSAVSTQQLVLKEIRILSSFAYSQQDFHDAVDMLADGSIPADLLVTGVYPLAGATEAIAAMVDRRPGQMKLLVAPND